jgi:hypothetical protein
MAGRSQHLEQIMENQTRFDLNAAIENWRNELAAQPNLASDDRRELETHLRDAIAEFQRRGLNDEESFWLARRRVGQPPQLGEEFLKENPMMIWRERAFWITVGVVMLQLWEMVGVSVTNGIMIHNRFFTSPHNHLENIMPQWITFYLPDWLLQANASMVFWDSWNTFQFVGGVIFVGCFAGGKLRLLCDFIFQNRLRFIAWASFSLAANYLISLMIWHSLVPKQYGRSFIFDNTDLCLYVLLIMFAAWLIPAQNRKTPKCA